MSKNDEIKKKGRKERKSSSSVDKRSSVGKTKKESEKKSLGGRKTSDKKSSLPLNDEQENSPGENQDDSLESPETNSLSRSSRDLEILWEYLSRQGNPCFAGSQRDDGAREIPRRG
jgi:hypothetical protein